MHRFASAVYLCAIWCACLSPFHCTLPAVAWRATADRAELGARDQARRLSADGATRSAGIRLLTRNGYDPAAPAVKREAEEDWGSGAPRIATAASQWL
jgi:hypothetical protein